MCCYDGIYLSEEEAETLRGVAREHAGFFGALGLSLPEEVIVEGEWQGEQRGPKTAVRSRDLSREVPGYPPHFADTACVFLLEDGRCGLQALSESRGLHLTLRPLGRLTRATKPFQTRQ